MFYDNYSKSDITQLLDKLRNYGILDDKRESRFDRLTHLIKDIMNAPIVIITIIDKDRQFFKSSVGLSEPLASARETPLTHSICQYAALNNEMLVIDDVATDPRFRNHSAISDFGVSAYMGVPIYLDSIAVGALCVVDTEPRKWTTQEISRLISFAAAVDDEIELSKLISISQRKADEVRAAKVDALQASKAKTEFIATISHEVRSPLTAVLGYTDLMFDESMTPQQKIYLKEIETAAERISALMKGTLELSMIEAGATKIAKNPFPLRTLCDKAGSLVRLSAVKTKLDLNIEVDASLPETVIGDEPHLHQVIVNLLNNAIKFTNEGSVTLRVTREPADGDVVRFEVTDTGIGIDDENQKRLFRRFSQADPSIQCDFGGCGLGLAISESFIKLMGGTITLESQLGRGSTFSFAISLPKVGPSPKLEQSETPNSPSALILVVCDRPSTRELVRTVLRKAGHTVDVACNSLEAIDAVRAGSYDLIIMDGVIAPVNGKTASSEIRNKGHLPARTPIIALTTGMDSQKDTSDARDGIDGFVAKSFRNARLVEVIDRWMSSPQKSYSFNYIPLQKNRSLMVR